MGSPGREPLGGAYEGGWGRRRARSLPVSRVACIADGIGKPRRGRGRVETSRDKNRGLVSFAICLCKLQRRAAGLRATVGGNTHVPPPVCLLLRRSYAPLLHTDTTPARPPAEPMPSLRLRRPVASRRLSSKVISRNCWAARLRDQRKPISHILTSRLLLLRRLTLQGLWVSLSRPLQLRRRGHGRRCGHVRRALACRLLRSTPAVDAGK